MSYIETSEGSCYSSVYAAAGAMGVGGGHPLSSTMRDSAPSNADFATWGERGSSSLTGASASREAYSSASASREAYSSASASREAYSSAASVSREGLSGAPCGGLVTEERTETVQEEETGRRVTETVRRALARHGAADAFRDALESSGGSEQAEAPVSTDRPVPAGLLEDMSAEEAEQRVRGLYRRLRGADHFRSLPTLDRSPDPELSPRTPEMASRAPELAPRNPENFEELWRRRRPVPHFPAELSMATVHARLSARLAALREGLEEPLRSDLSKYVAFIGTGCLDPADEAVKREMAERVMRLLLQREEVTPDAGTRTQDRSGAASPPGRPPAAADDSPWDAGADQWERAAPFRARVPSPYSRQRPGSPGGRGRLSGAASPRGELAATAEEAELRERRAERGRPTGAWRHQLTRSERHLQAGTAADGEESEASEPAWRSHNYSRALDDAHRGRQTDTTSSDYDFSTIRSRQRRLEDATASSFEYYDPAPRRRSSPDEAAAAPEVSVRSPARSVSPPSPAPEPEPQPEPGSEEPDHSDLLRLLRHTTDNVIRHSREIRTRRTPVPLSMGSEAETAAETRHRPRSRTGRGGWRSGRSASGEASRQLGQLVGQHRQKHVHQLQQEIAKLGRLERLLLGGSTVQLEACDSSEDGTAAAETPVADSSSRQGVEGRSSPSDSDPPPEPSSAYARIRATLQRRRRQIAAQLADMDRRHRRYGRRLETFSDVAEEAGSESESEGRAGRRSGAGGRRDGQRRAVSSQETTTQTSSRRSGSRGESGSPAASVRTYSRRSRVTGSDTGTQTTPRSEDPSGAVQVFTRRTRLSPPTTTTTQTTTTTTRRRSASSTSRSASGGSQRRPSAGSPRRTVTVTRRPVICDPPRHAHRAVQTTRSPERTVTVTRRRAVPGRGQGRSPPSPPRQGSAVQTVTRRRKLSAPRPASPSRKETVVRRRLVGTDRSRETETISTTADTTADTPATVRSSVTNEEGMRDALEPSDRSGRRTEDLEQAERLLETLGDSATASRSTEIRDVSVSRHPVDSPPPSASLSTVSSSGGPPRSPDSRRAQRLLREGVRVDELERAQYRADFCQELPSCPASPRREWPRSSEESRSVGTQTQLLGDGGTVRYETVRRQVHSDDSEVIHHPPRPPATRRSVAYFLSVRRGPLPAPPCEEPRCRRVLPAVRLSQELLGRCGSDSGGTECVREQEAEECDEQGRRVSVTQRRPAGRPSEDECVSLQEALCRRRPDYIRNAAVRRQYLQRLAALRRSNLERAARAADTLPDLPTDADWGYFTEALRPESVRRAFDYRDMRQHTERLWRRLPEIRDCVSKRKKHAQFRTNRLMWQVYRQKLQERCLRGDLHLTHRDAVLGGI